MQIQSIKQIYIDKKVAHVGTQSDESLYEETNRLHAQLQFLDEHAQMCQGESQQLRDAMERQLADMDRIIEEKR